MTQCTPFVTDVMGKARIISDPAEKEQRLKAFTEKLFPGRWDILRPVTAKELKRRTAKSVELRSLNPEHADRVLSTDEIADVVALTRAVDWVWIAGNHDGDNTRDHGGSRRIAHRARPAAGRGLRLRGRRRRAGRRLREFDRRRLRPDIELRCRGRTERRIAR